MLVHTKCSTKFQAHKIQNCMYSRHAVAHSVSYLQVSHGDLVLHVMFSVLHLPEQTVERVHHDARLLMAPEHGVGLTSTCRWKKIIVRLLQALVPPSMHLPPSPSLTAGAPGSLKTAYTRPPERAWVCVEAMALYWTPPL